MCWPTHVDKRVCDFGKKSKFSMTKGIEIEGRSIMG